MRANRLPPPLARTSFHDALYLREVLGLRPAPEFEAWLPAKGQMLQLLEAVG